LPEKEEQTQVAPGLQSEFSVQVEREVVAPTQVPFEAQVRSSPQAVADRQVCPCVPLPDAAHIPLMQSFPGAQFAVAVVLHAEP